MATDPNSWPAQVNLVPPLVHPDEIRILYLAPITPDAKITCTMSNVRLSETPEYEALSYEWGPERFKVISLNGSDIKVRQNLFDALSCLQFLDRVRALWIDAICINQENIKERNHQVSQMASIYKQARMVVVWLGWPGNALTDSVVTCQMALRFLQRTLDYVGQFYDYCLVPESPYHWVNDERVKSRHIMSGLQSLSRKRYWTRLWVIQEVLLASQVQVQCGYYCISWKTLQRVCQHIQNQAIPLQQVELREIAESRMTTFMAGIPETATMSLSYLCWLHGEADCEKLLDKVFGLWALAPSCCQEAVPVDYSSTFDEVMQKLWDHDIAVHGMPADNAANVDEFKKGLFGNSKGSGSATVPEWLSNPEFSNHSLFTSDWTALNPD